jgi:hypothetical protein
MGKGITDREIEALQGIVPLDDVAILSAECSILNLDRYATLRDK